MLTKSPLSITFHPAYDRNIAGPSETMWPGSFDGGTASGSSDAQASGGTSESGVWNPWMHGDLFMFRYEHNGRYQFAAGAIGIKQTSRSGPYYLRRFFGTVDAPTGDDIDWAAIGSQANALSICDRGAIFSCMPGVGSYTNYGIECAWGENGDEVGASVAMSELVSGNMGIGYAESATPDADLVPSNATAHWGSTVRYRRINSESYHSICVGGVNSSGNVSVSVGYRSSERADPVWTEQVGTSHVSSSDEHYSGENNSRLMQGIGRWWTGGFDINKDGKFVIAWVARVENGQCVCIWTGTVDEAGGIVLGNTMSGVAKVFIPYDNDVNGDVPQYIETYWEGSPGNSNTFLHYNPDADESEGMPWAPRHPQVVITEGASPQVFIHLAYKGRDVSYIGKHEWSTSYLTSDSGNMSTGWDWHTESDAGNDWAYAWGPPCDHDPNGTEVCFVVSGVPYTTSSGSGPDSFSRSSFLDDLHDKPSWQSWGCVNFAYKTCRHETSDTTHTYMCAAGITMEKPGSIWTPVKLYGVIWAADGDFSPSLTLRGTDPMRGRCMEICSYGDI